MPESEYCMRVQVKGFGEKATNFSNLFYFIFYFLFYLFIFCVKKFILMLACLHIVYPFCYLTASAFIQYKFSWHTVYPTTYTFILLSHLSTHATLLLFYCYNISSSPLCFVFCCTLQKCLRLTCFLLNLLLIFNNCLN
jgi:hypothetical protein